MDYLAGEILVKIDRYLYVRDSTRLESTCWRIRSLFSKTRRRVRRLKWAVCDEIDQINYSVETRENPDRSDVNPTWDFSVRSFPDHLGGKITVTVFRRNVNDQPLNCVRGSCLSTESNRQQLPSRGFEAVVTTDDRLDVEISYPYERSVKCIQFALRGMTLANTQMLHTAELINKALARSRDSCGFQMLENRVASTFYPELG
jgi:hypothetical protein